MECALPAEQWRRERVKSMETGQHVPLPPGIRLSGQNRDAPFKFRRRLEALGDGAEGLVGQFIAEQRAEYIQRA